MWAAAAVPDPQVVGWGDVRDGQASVPAAARSGVTAISAGGVHSLALKQDGTVVAWGATGTLGASANFGQATPPAPKADLSLAVAATTNASARTVTYTLTVTDKGPSAATRVSTVALLPKGTSLVSASGAPARAGTRILLWRADSVAANASITYTATVRYAGSGSRTLVAVTGSSQTPDPSLANNAAASTAR